MKIQYKTINELDVYPKDIGDATWHQAIKACEALGDGWRLPTKGEIDVLYKNRKLIGGFASDFYWSSSEIDADIAWNQSFNYGNLDGSNKTVTSYVRPVRTTASQLIGTPWA